ncbi:hypothetical protein BDQ94DRAFT_152261 [Aspergillus welwitschiae]|uniref:Uncharacterized protein n=1 Tax=Aspergillus welwitschiae TaxID=1341132 RepID=A0A3F3PN86_9EURO|nr:hypothetical protein BDQ94DRAFT_152261 [Aspergillus welwitschiae]RDH28387.1 hypothetical protein BDQ94DRAFT_152261 [Aspergillus welwitschiae]
MEAAWLRWNLVGNPSPGGFPGESPDAPRALRSQQAQPIRRLKCNYEFIPASA